MRLRRLIVDLVLLTIILLLPKYMVEGTVAFVDSEQQVERDFFEKFMFGLMQQRRMFLDGFSNATAILQREYDAIYATGEARGRRKRLKQMNRTLMAIVMAYSLKFMFLIPTFIGTLILFKFTAALAGFFYALFAAVLGLDR